MMYLIIGGSGSGKSAYAEELLFSLPDAGKKYYIATMQVCDEESRRRVQKHRKQREGKRFYTIEQPVHVSGALTQMGAGKKSAMLECVSNLVANEMFREDGFHPEVAEKITEGVKTLLSQAKHVVIVTNEIFSDGILYGEESEQYKKELGQINQKLAELAEEVVEVVYGIPVWHKGGKKA